MNKKKSPSNSAAKSQEIPKDLYASATPGGETVKPELKIDIPKPDAILGQQPAGDMTVARMLGEIVWIMTQSPGHKHFALGDLEWMVMPALLLEQYRIFRNGDQPLGVALWAYLSPEAEEKLKSGVGRLRPDEWAVGMKLEAEGGGREAGGSSSRSGSDGRSPHQQTHAVSKEEGGALWLVDLICPFHTPDNKMADQMLADLIKGPFKGKKFKFHHIDPATGQRKVMELKG